MGIKEKLLGKNKEFKEEDEFPEDFVETKDAKEAIAKAGDKDIVDFIAKKKALEEEKDAVKSKKGIEEEPISVPAKQLEDIIPETPQIEEQSQERQSSFAKILTIYLTPDKVDQTKSTLQSAIDGGYSVGMQAGIQVTKENVKGVNSILKYLADNGYLVVISGEQVGPVFDEATK